MLAEKANWQVVAVNFHWFLLLCRQFGQQGIEGDNL